jgi:predicted NodU family carbamoyl transferase
MAAHLMLGINAYHGDAAACIVRDGKLLAAQARGALCSLRLRYGH